MFVPMMDKAIELLKEICDYNDGNGKYNFQGLDDQQRDNEAFDTWMQLRERINVLIEETKS